MKASFLLVSLMFAPASAYASPHDVIGLWVSEAQDGHIQITDCGDGTPCGRLVWVDPAKADSAMDARNKDKSLRHRPLIGVPIVWNFQRSNKGWKSGKIYNPQDGKTFAAHIIRQNDTTLKVKGCLGFICITNIWTQFSASPDATLSKKSTLTEELYND